MARDIPSNSFRTAVLTLLIVCVAPLPARSQEQQGFAKVGGYAGGTFVPQFTLDGETFDGLTYYQEVGGDEIALLPKLDKQGMFRGILGYRGEKAAIELSYERANHNGTFGEGGTGKATFQQVNVDARFFFLTHARIQPYVLLGSGFPWLTIRDGSFLENEPEAGFADGTFRGFALNTEVGVTVYPHPQVGIVLGYGYRPIWFYRATGITDTHYDLRPRFRENSKGLVFTTLFTF
jgi:Outer membrane protein beta-barrel domain